MSDQLAAEAEHAAEIERSMSLFQSLKRYRKAALWSIVFSTSIIMEGYDTMLIGAFLAYPQFQKKYGTQLPDGSYQIPAVWQSSLSNGALVGEILGLTLNGYLAERLGYRKTMAISLISLIGLIFIPFFSPNLAVLLVGAILQGIPWGVFQTLSLSYASEICPVNLRAHLTTYVNICWVFGQLIASGVLKALLNRADEWGYR